MPFTCLALQRYHDFGNARKQLSQRVLLREQTSLKEGHETFINTIKLITSSLTRSKRQTRLLCLLHAKKRTHYHIRFATKTECNKTLSDQLILEDNITQKVLLRFTLLSFLIYCPLLKPAIPRRGSSLSIIPTIGRGPSLSIIPTIAQTDGSPLAIVSASGTGS